MRSEHVIKSKTDTAPTHNCNHADNRCDRNRGSLAYWLHQPQPVPNVILKQQGNAENMLKTVWIVYLLTASGYTDDGRAMSIWDSEKGCLARLQEYMNEQHRNPADRFSCVAWTVQSADNEQ